MSDKYKIYDKEGLYFITITVVGWIDVFTRSEYCEELIKNFNYCIKQKGLRIYSFCIMPSHVHFIARTEGEDLSNILRDFKSYTAKRIIKMIEDSSEESRKEWLLYMFKFFANKNTHNANYQFWQQNNHSFYLYSKSMIEQKVNYIHNNPVTASIVTEPAYYVYSSANEFCGIELSEM